MPQPSSARFSGCPQAEAKTLLGAYGDVAITLWPGWVTSDPDARPARHGLARRSGGRQPAADTRAQRVTGVGLAVAAVVSPRGAGRRCGERAGTIRLMLSPLTTAAPFAAAAARTAAGSPA